MLVKPIDYSLKYSVTEFSLDFDFPVEKNLFNRIGNAIWADGAYYEDFRRVVRDTRLAEVRGGAHG